MSTFYQQLLLSILLVLVKTYTHIFFAAAIIYALGLLAGLTRFSFHSLGVMMILCGFASLWVHGFWQQNLALILVGATIIVGYPGDSGEWLSLTKSSQDVDNTAALSFKENKALNALRTMDDEDIQDLIEQNALNNHQADILIDAHRSVHDDHPQRILLASAFTLMQKKRWPPIDTVDPYQKAVIEESLKTYKKTQASHRRRAWKEFYENYFDHPWMPFRRWH